MPFSRKMASAAGVVGPFAPSRMIFALTRGRVLRGEHALERGRNQHVTVHLRAPRPLVASSVAPGKFRIDPVAFAMLEHLVLVQPGRDRRWPLPSRRSRRSASRRPHGRTSRRDSRRCRGPGRRRACPRGRWLSPSRFISAAWLHASRSAKYSPRPVASLRPRTPPSVTGLPVTQADRIELSGIELRVGVDNPRHLPLAGAVVGRRHVEPGADEAFLGELVGVAAGDALELRH